MPPSLATYQQAANAIYEPQKAAEANTLTTERNAEIATLEGSKGQVQTDYQSAIDSLTSQTNKNVATINQLYTLRLGGNFSGLQGNDLGGMFATAGKQQGAIESTRANKLSQIAISEANTTNKFNTEIGNLGSKYQGLEEQYAQTNYGEAVKEYNTEQDRQFTHNLELAKLGIEQQKLSQGRSPSQGEIRSQNMAGAAQFLNGAAGKDGHVNPVDWRAAATNWQNAGGSIADFTKSFGNFINQHDKKAHYVGYN